ncbi:MAG: FmdB family zinc ribbon protein [candidate division Zixibacteria bacterium]|nr:FmdB family zinc ribbon protein [candidate division Zixibacteria bacterium]
MPTYLYHCIECGHRFEEFQSITDEPIDKCPVCKGKAERIITGGVGFLFKGSGFYITDHRSEKYKKEASTDRGETGPASSSKSSPSKKSKDTPEKTKAPPKKADSKQ